MTKNETKKSDVVEMHTDAVKPHKAKNKKGSRAFLLLFVAFLVGMLVMTLVQAQRPQNLGSDAATSPDFCQSLSEEQCTSRPYNEICDFKENIRYCTDYSDSEDRCDMVEPPCEKVEKSCTDYHYDNCPTDRGCTRNAGSPGCGPIFKKVFSSCTGGVVRIGYRCVPKPVTSIPTPTLRPAATNTPRPGVTNTPRPGVTTTPRPTARPTARPTSRPVPTTPPSSYCAALEPSMCTPANGCKLVGSDCVPAPRPTSTPTPRPIGGVIPTAIPTGGGGGGTAPEPTSPPPDYGERCRVKGRVEFYDNQNLRNASNVVRWTSLDTLNFSTNAEGVYSIDKRYSNVGETFELRVNNPYLTYRTFEVKGTVPSGCTVTNNGTTIRCNKSVCYERNENLVSFNFEEKGPSRPNSKISNVNNLTYGQTLTWTVEATDGDGNLQSTGIYLHSGTPVVGETQGWSVLKWVGGQKAPAVTYRHSDTAGVTRFVCDASKAGTWTVSTNARDTMGLNCSGNPVNGEVRCASNPNDRKTFTCTAGTTAPAAQISTPIWNSNWSLNNLSQSIVKVNASGDPSKEYDVIAYIYEIPWSANTNVWAAVTSGTSFSCEATSGKWSEISRKRVPKGYFSLQNRKAVDLPAITQQKWDQAKANGLSVEVGKRYLIAVNVVATDFRTAGNNSYCTGSPAVSTTGRPCWGTNWCNSANNRSSGGMFQVINLTQ